jgi:DNA polymerase III delta prime subunit
MNQNNMSWTEKYRPNTLEDVIGNVNIINTLKNYIGDVNFPHMCLCGTAGIGKTTTALAFVNSYLNYSIKNEVPDITNENLNTEKRRRYVEHNASDTRGIDFIRNEIKDYAIKSHLLRFIILDEADELTNQAQDSLKRIMEKYKNVKFILTCNKKENIIAPILSRCSVFEFKKPTDEELIERLKLILKNENLNVEDEKLKYLLEYSKRDIRQSINSLYNITHGLEINAENKNLDNDVKSMINFAIKNNLQEYILKMEDLLSNYTFIEIINKIRDITISHQKLPELLKYHIIKNICEIEYRFKLGVSEITLLAYLFVQINEEIKLINNNIS